MNFIEKIKDDTFRGIVYFVLAAISVLLFKFSQSNADSDGKSLLITAFIFLFIMLSIFIWTNKNNKLLVSGAIILYVFFAWYWL